jgi:hypothetical protein
VVRSQRNVECLTPSTHDLGTALFHRICAQFAPKRSDPRRPETPDGMGGRFRKISRDFLFIRQPDKAPAGCTPDDCAPNNRAKRANRSPKFHKQLQDTTWSTHSSVLIGHPVSSPPQGTRNSHCKAVRYRSQCSELSKILPSLCRENANLPVIGKIFPNLPSTWQTGPLPLPQYQSSTSGQTAFRPNLGDLILSPAVVSVARILGVPPSAQATSTTTTTKVVVGWAWLWPQNSCWKLW